MMKYEAMRPLFVFLAMPKTSKKHWSGNSGWTIVEFLHQEVLQITKVTIEACFPLTTIVGLFCMMIMEFVVWMVTLMYIVG